MHGSGGGGSQSHDGPFPLGKSPRKKRDAGPDILTPGEAGARAGAGFRGRLPGPEVWNAIINVCVPGRLARVQEDSAAAPSDSV